MPLLALHALVTPLPAAIEAPRVQLRLLHFQGGTDQGLDTHHARIGNGVKRPRPARPDSLAFVPIKEREVIHGHFGHDTPFSPRSRLCSRPASMVSKRHVGVMSTR